MIASQRLVHDALTKYGPTPVRLLAQYLDKPVNAISPRVNELRELGLVELSHKDKYPLDGRTVSWWKVVDARQG